MKMKISQLLKILQSELETSGDLPVEMICIPPDVAGADAVPLAGTFTVLEDDGSPNGKPAKILLCDDEAMASVGA